MGGMSAQIPIKNDPAANEVAMNKVRADKLREVTNGHDGTWIAHPLINGIAMEIFNKYMLGPNQVSSPQIVPVQRTHGTPYSTTSAERMSKSQRQTCSTPRCPARSPLRACVPMSRLR